MRAALLRAPGSLAIEDIATPQCPEGGILLKVEACSICSTDIKMSKVGHRDLIYPRILGHEVVGTIESSNSPNSDLLPGIRVQIWPGLACGKCPACRRGYDNQCPSIGILGFNRDGGFAEFMAVPKETIARGGVLTLPDTIDAATASLTEPLACCVNAQDHGMVKKGESVLVIGAGPLGAMHTMLAKRNGAIVLVAERDDMRCRMIERAGPDMVIDTGSTDLKESIDEFTSSLGMDHIILATPKVPIDDHLISLLAPRGKLCLFSGLPSGGADLTLNLNQVHYLERSMFGAYGCPSSSNRKALHLLTAGELDLSWLITKRVSLERIHEGIEHAAHRLGMKAAVTEF